MAQTPQVPNDRLRADVINAPTVRTIEPLVLNTFVNDAWSRGLFRAYVHGGIARERSTVSIASGCRV